MSYNLTREQLKKHARDNQDAMLFFMHAADDYLAARCCILNGVVSIGCRLASESIEKLLKAAICFESGSKSKVKGRNLHNPYALKEELKEHRDYRLEEYDTQLLKLHDHYESRYHDNSVSGEGASSDELIYIDEIWLHIVERLPLPEEVLFRSMFFAQLVSDFGYVNWLTKKNSAFGPKLDYFKMKSVEVWNYYSEQS